MYCVDWKDGSEADSYVVLAVHEAETVSGLPALGEGLIRHVDEKIESIEDFDGNPITVPIGDLLGFQVFPSPPGEFDKRVILRSQAPVMMGQQGKPTE